VNKKKAVFAAVAALAMVAPLAACSGGGNKGGASPKLTNCTNKIVNKSAPTVSVWAWYPNTAKVVDNFNNSHKDVQVCWTVAGQGAAEYAKFQTAIAAGKGAPDVIMLEAEVLTGFEIQKALVDLSKYGANDVKKNFSAGAWKDVSQGSSVYAIPVDGGPMAMIYRKDIFDKYGITTPPKTWAEYEIDAQKVKDAGGPLFGDIGSNVPAAVTALMAQKGAVPCTYDLADSKNISIKRRRPSQQGRSRLLGRSGEEETRWHREPVHDGLHRWCRQRKVRNLCVGGVGSRLPYRRRRRQGF